MAKVELKQPIVQEIAEQIKDTVEVTEILKPVYNFKAGSRK